MDGWMGFKFGRRIFTAAEPADDVRFITVVT